MKEKWNLISCIKGGSQDRQAGYLITFKYDEELIETLKNSIPHTEREWREESKTWWVSENYECILNTLFKNFYALVYQQAKMF